MRMLPFLFIAITLQTLSCTTEKFKLITVLYNEKVDARVKEYLICLERNLAHECIDTIHIVYDISHDDDSNTILNYIQSKNIPVTFVEGRPSYAFCFELANTLFPNSRIILSNADIYFNDTLRLLDRYNLAGKFLALTRWDILKEGSLELHSYSRNKKRCFSQDTWIFSTPFHFVNANVLLGTKGCDCAIAFIAHENGLPIMNPCLSIQACHLHLSKIRNYDQTLISKDLMPLAYSSLSEPLPKKAEQSAAPKNPPAHICQKCKKRLRKKGLLS